jgi:hypothetical protein
MNRFVLAFVLALLALLFAASAQAADNAIVLTPGTGVTERSIDVGAGVQAPGVVLVNSAGTNLIGAGTSVPVSGTLAATQSGTWNIAAVTSITNPVAATQSGAWTITQGTAGASAWLVTGTGGTFPATQSGTWNIAAVTSITNPVAATQSGAWTITQGTAGASAWLVTGTGGVFPATQSGTWTVNPGNTANTTAWLVTGTGGVFPASQSGTWNITNISGTVSLPTGAASSANQPSNAALGSTTAGQTGNLTLGAVTTGAPTYVTGQTNALSLDTAGNLRVNVTAGAAGGTSSNFGATFPPSGTALGLTNGSNMVAWSATTTYGTAPAAIAVPAVNAAVTNTVAITANASVNVNQWVGTSLGVPTAWGTAPTGNVPGVNVNIQGCAAAICNTNGQKAMAASAPVVIASDQTNLPTNALQWNSVSLGSPTAWGTAPSGNVVGMNVNLVATTGVTDPCTFKLKTYQRINLTATGPIVTGQAGTKTYICSFDVVTATAQGVALVEGTGTNCATNIYALAGGITALTGWQFAANSGIARGSGSATWVYGSGDGNATAANVCLLLSGSGQTSGTIGYVQQ